MTDATLATLAVTTLPAGAIVHFETETGEGAQCLRKIVVRAGKVASDTVEVCDDAGDVHGPFDYASGSWRDALADVLHLSEAKGVRS